MTSSHEYEHPLSRPCALCGSRTARKLSEFRFATFDGTPIAGQFPLAACGACGFAFYDTPSSQIDFDRYYQENAYYYTSTTAGSGGSSPQEAKRFEALAERLAPHIRRSDAAVLDIGCAKGGLLEVMAKRGHTRLFGVDMLPGCVRRVKETLGLQAETGSAIDLPFPDVAADVLVYSHVVEHVIDLDALTAAAREKLAENGVLYVEVPDASRYGEHSSAPYHDFYLEHVNHFDMTTLLNLFIKAGFAPISMGEHLLEAAPKERVPCIWAVFRKGKAEPSTPSRNAERRLREYALRSEHHPLLGALSQLAHDRTPLHVWGVSQFAMLLLGQTDLRRCNLRSLVDRDAYKQKRTLQQRRVNPPESLRSADKRDMVVVTALGYEEQILASIREVGFEGAVLTLPGSISPEPSASVHSRERIRLSKSGAQSSAYPK